MLKDCRKKKGCKNNKAKIVLLYSHVYTKWDGVPTSTILTG